MANYIQQRLEVINLVKSLISKGNYTKQDIAFMVMETTGFSEKFIYTYIDQKIKRGEVVEDEEIVRWA